MEDQGLKELQPRVLGLRIIACRVWFSLAYVVMHGDRVLTGLLWCRLIGLSAWVLKVMGIRDVSVRMQVLISGPLAEDL